MFVFETWRFFQDERMQASSHVFHRQGCMFSPKQNGSDPITFAIKIRMPILAKNINYKNRWVYYRNITKYISTIQYPFSEKKHGRVFTKQIFGPTIQLSWLSFCSIGLLEIIERSFLRHGSRGEVRGLWSMEEVLHQVDMENGRLMSCVYRFLYIPSGTWFLPSTVSIGVM